MGKFYDGYENIKVELLQFSGNDLARQCIEFGRLGEFYEGASKSYSPDDEECKKIVNEIISGKTFPKYAFEGHALDFRIHNISRVCLAQLTREQGFFCSASGDVRPLSQEFITPKAIYARKDWMKRLEDIESNIESLYIDMCEAGIPYMESRYFGFHAQTISLAYHAPVMTWLRSCNTRTENNFADEINYIYRLMLRELKNAVANEVTDPLSIKLWNWLLAMADNKSWYKRDHTYNNDFARYATPEGYVFDEYAHNDWRKSSWKLELEKMYHEKPELLFDGEKEMIESWLKLESEGKELPSTYKADAPYTVVSKIKDVYYYKDSSNK